MSNLRERQKQMDGKSPQDAGRNPLRRIMMITAADMRHDHEIMQMLMDDIDAEDNNDDALDHRRRRNLFDFRMGR